MSSNKTVINAPTSFLGIKSPTLVPSVLFTIFFAVITMLHLYRTFQKTRRRWIACIFLFSFSLTRTLAFIFRCAWAENNFSTGFAMASNLFLAGGFFLVCQSFYILFKDLIVSIPQFLRKEERILRLISLINYLPPVFSIIGIIGVTREYGDRESTEEFNAGRNCTKISTIGFTTLVGFLLIMTTFYAVKYRAEISSSQKTRLIAVLYFATSLLLLELVYKVISSFSTSTDNVNREQWVFYVFEAVPELISLIFLGAVNVGQLFYSNDEDSKNANRNSISNDDNDNTRVNTTSDIGTVIEVTENEKGNSITKIV